jgi:predicted Fe-Mo cluster-binding NifX family protein
MSREYRLFSIENGEVEREWVIANPYADPAKHKHAETDDIMGVLDGVHVCIGRKMGRKSPPIIYQYGRIPLLTRLEQVDDCLQAFLEVRSEVFQAFSVEEDQWGPLDTQTLRRLVTGDAED